MSIGILFMYTIIRYYHLPIHGYSIHLSENKKSHIPATHQQHEKVSIARGIEIDGHTFLNVSHRTSQQQFRIDKLCASHNWAFLLLSIHLNCWPIQFRMVHRDCPSWRYENHRLSSNPLWSMVEFPRMIRFLWSDRDMMIPGCVLYYWERNERKKFIVSFSKCQEIKTKQLNFT